MGCGAPRAGAGEGGVIYLPVSGAAGIDSSSVIEIYERELEAFKLVHLEGLTIDEAAERMGLPKATFWRALESCRGKLALALAEGRPFKLVSLSAKNAGES